MTNNAVHALGGNPAEAHYYTVGRILAGLGVTAATASDLARRAYDAAREARRLPLGDGDALCCVSGLLMDDLRRLGATDNQVEQIGAAALAIFGNPRAHEIKSRRAVFASVVGGIVLCRS